MAIILNPLILVCVYSCKLVYIVINKGNYRRNVCGTVECDADFFDPHNVCIYKYTHIDKSIGKR